MYIIRRSQVIDRETSGSQCIWGGLLLCIGVFEIEPREQVGRGPTVSRRPLNPGRSRGSISMSFLDAAGQPLCMRRIDRPS